jgi:DNA invertase Pin-like site-specific DNA recombinase
MTRRLPTRPAPTEPQRVVAYRRVSPDEQGDSGLGLDAQYADIRAAVEQRGWLLVADIAEVASGSTAFPDRDGGVQALLVLDAGEADVLMVAKQDRLSGSREASVVRAYAKRMRWQVDALDVGDTTEPDGDRVSNIRAVFALYKRRKMAQRTKVALAVLAKTAHVGRPFVMDLAIRDRILRERKAGRGLGEIANRLSADGIPASRGGIWTPGTIQGVVRRGDAPRLPESVSKKKGKQTRPS